MFLPELARAQILVQPRRAFKSPVREFEFDWRYVDVLASPRPDGSQEGAGLRLYFYERERDIASLAVPLITRSYELLTARFEYAPTTRFPYVLYNTYQEFLQTNLFAAQEGVLGVTSPVDLTLTLPYFGDHKKFFEVSTHELAHQFTIQKLRDVARRARIRTSPIEGMPLWFIEGLAEYYAQDGLDPETEMLARDIVVNPDVRTGYALLGFFDDRPWSVLWTYKLGQARCAFLEQTYGEGTLQEIIESSPRLVSAPKRQARLTFPQLLARVTGDEPQTMNARFVEWLKRRAYTSYLEASQPAMSILPLERDFDGEYVLSMSASPNGNIIMYRRIMPDTGQTQLAIVNSRAPRRERVVVADGVPGAESLHPIATRNFQVGTRKLVYVAEVNNHDALYVQEVRLDQGQVKLGDRVRYELGELADLVAVDAPALSPDDERVAFVGTDRKGFRDVYVLDTRKDPPEVARVTDDIWAERQVSWGKAGIVYTSDAVPGGHYNLFRMNPDSGGGAVQLTNEPRDLFDPMALPDGRILFVAWENGRADVHELREGRILRRTGTSTGFGDVAPGPSGSLWALQYESGQRRPVQLRAEHFLEVETAGFAAPGDPAEPLLREPLAQAETYDPAALKNWSLGQIFGILGAGGGGIYGELYATASDRMRDHGLVLQASIYGRLDLTDGLLLYVNQASRIGTGFGVFQSLSFRNDQTFAARGLRFSSLERFYGGIGLLRFPFSTYEYAEAQVALGAVSYFLDGPERRYLAAGDYNGTGEDLVDDWDRENGTPRLQGELRLRLGRDTIRYHRATGPLAGSSLLLETSITSQPQRRATFGDVRLDASRYFALGGAANLFARGGAGTTYGGELARQFYLSSFDTLRGVTPGDADFLMGRDFFFGTLELQLPLSSIVRVLFMPNVEGIIGLDFGAVGDEWDTILDKRVLDFALGMNFVFGPMVLRLHFANNIDTGAVPERAGLARSSPAEGWVTNLSLNWLYL